MKRIGRLWQGLLALTFAGTLSVSADDFTGDPVADGWTPHGNSLTLGTYIRGFGGFSFDVYSHSFTLDESSPLLDGFYWAEGDQVLGLGGVNLSGYIYEPRLVAKFGAAGSIFSPSSTLTPPGDGNGSFSAGDGGLGSVQIDYEYEFGTINTNALDPAFQNNGILLPDNVLYYDGSSSNVDWVYGALLSLFTTDGNGADVLQSFEVVLNITALSDTNRGGLVGAIPVVNGISNMALQENLGVFTDAFVIPEPSTLALVLFSVVGFARTLKRRHSR